MSFSAGTLLKNIGRFFYPPHCVYCEVATFSSHALCPSCWNKTRWIERPFCKQLGTPFMVDYGENMLSPAAITNPPNFDHARAAALHAGIAKKIVSRFKYGDRLELVDFMANMMVRAGGDILKEADLLIPVPLHPFRLWKRRYNQAALLTKIISKETNIPLSMEILERKKYTRPQVGLHREERKKNIAGAFNIGKEKYIHLAGKHVVLIDDVRTTGTTINACAKAVRTAGARRVDALTFTMVGDGMINIGTELDSEDYNE